MKNYVPESVMNANDPLRMSNCKSSADYEINMTPPSHAELNSQLIVEQMRQQDSITINTSKPAADSIQAIDQQNTRFNNTQTNTSKLVIKNLK